MEYVDMYDIRYQVTYYKDKEDMYLEAQKINFNNISGNYDNALLINELVYINTEAKEKEPDLSFDYYTYQKYDYTFVNLSNNLEKEVNKG